MRTDKQNTKKKKNGILPKNNWYKVLLLLMMLVGAGFLAMLALVDAFPASMVIGFIVVLVAMIVICDLLFMCAKKWKRIVGIVLSVIFLLLYGLGIYYLVNTYTMFARVTTNATESSVEAKSVDVTEDSFNVYISGIDQWSKEKGYDLERSDVNMIMTVCPKTRKITLTSIPRDAYVALHRTGTMDKLTHTGIYGVDETLNTVEDWTGLELNYYVKMNFDACVDIVNAIGGIDVESPKAFKSAISHYKYKKGMNHLNGKAALYYARERKAFDGEDQLRVRNQLQVVEATMDKVMSSSTLLTSYDEIMETLGDEMETNMPQEDIQALVKMQLSDLTTWDIESQRMSGEYDLEVVASLDSSNKYTVLKVSDESFNSCLENIEKTLNPSAAEIAEATAARQKNSLLSFFRSLKGGE